MAVQHSKPGERLHQTKILNPATADLSPDNEVFWQQLMVFNYVLSEVIGAMERERATSRRRPLHQSWQNFVYQLRLKKTKLGTCLDHWLLDGFLGEQEGAP
ncbi:MAG: hypothetical protein P8Y45_23370 [Exilibacterium sp.]